MLTGRTKIHRQGKRGARKLLMTLLVEGEIQLNKAAKSYHGENITLLQEVTRVMAVTRVQVTTVTQALHVVTIR